MKMECIVHGRKIAQVSAAAVTLLLLSNMAQSGPRPLSRGSHSPTGQASIMASYSKSDNGNHSYSTERRYTATLSINLTSVTEIELSFTSSKNFVNYDPYQTTTTYSDILGLSFIQTLVPANWPLQPYAKAGIGQYNRKQEGTINGIANTPVTTKSPSAILGGGLRIFVASAFSLKIEAVAYLPNMRGPIRNNYSAQAGVGWHF